MDFIGVIATLLLIIILSQAKFFNFLIDTAVGRIVLITFILGISYTNKILGIVSVLFIIIMFNQSGIYEGFKDLEQNINKDLDLNKDKKPLIPSPSINQDQTTTTSSIVSSTPTDSFVGGREGFNMLDREDTMLKGKRSNEVPVFSNARSQLDNVEPTDSAVFTSSYESI
jgi:hypothetical protein